MSQQKQNPISIPGPKASKLLEKRMQHVPRGVGSPVPTLIDTAEGAQIIDVDGNELLDFAGGIGMLNVGHRPEQLVEKLKEQLDQYIHPGFPVLMYEPYIALAEKLNQITPGIHPKKTFFLNSGAEAVENAVKIARKYTRRPAVISFERGFHGRTLLTMSLTSKVKPYKYEFGPFAPEIYKMPYPDYYRSDYDDPSRLDTWMLARLDDFFLSEVPANHVAAIIMEPVQGEGGFIVPSKAFVQGVKKLCEQHGILFIADEIQTGFGRTGKMFAMEHFDVVPDLITQSKSIAAGLPLSAVTGRAEIMDAPSPGEIGGTYGGSPLGCVAALEVICMLENGLIKRGQEVGQTIMNTFQQWQDQFDFIGDVRGLGAMCAFEIVHDRQTKEPDASLAAQIVERCAHHGVLVLKAGLYSNVIRTLMPLVIRDEQLHQGLERIYHVLKGISK